MKKITLITSGELYVENSNVYENKKDFEKGNTKLPTLEELKNGKRKKQ